MKSIKNVVFWSNKFISKFKQLERENEVNFLSILYIYLKNYNEGHIQIK